MIVDGKVVPVDKDWGGQESEAPVNVKTALRPEPCPFLRKSFNLVKPFQRARLYATALGLYELHVNGKRVGQDYFAPGWTDYKKRVYYQTYDVTEILRRGENAIGAILADGWYAGQVGWVGHRNWYGPAPRLLLQLEIDGETVACSDGSWKATTGPIITSDLQDGETYDARREFSGWDSAGFDDSAWRPVEATDVTLGPTADPAPPIRVTQILKPISKTGAIFDLGQNMVGWPRIRVKAPAGTIVTVRCGEALNADGTLHTGNLSRARCTDRYICKGGGEETFEAHFTFRGFRYAQVTGADATLEACVAHSNTPNTGSFECSDEMVNKLQRNITWGRRGTFVSVPTDCPQRAERLGWMGDAQIFVRTACFNMDVDAFFTKWMRDVEDAQSAEGGFSNVSPRAVNITDGAPAWGDAGIIVPWTIYQCYGDTRILEA
jgi:alpha-L-rhamnosidase